MEGSRGRWGSGCLNLSVLQKQSCLVVSAWLAGDTGEQGDKGAKGYGLSGYTGDQGANGKSIS